MSNLAGRLAAIKPSPTIAITNLARELQAAGRDVIGLAAGEPDFGTPEHVKRAAIAAIGAGETKYTAVDGTPALKAAIVAKFARENGIDYAAEQISVGAGGKQVIFNALLASLDPGDEVIIPAPYWVSYPDMVRLAGGIPVAIPCPEEQGFKLSAWDLEAAIGPRTRWLILNSPSNPTGAAYDESQLRPLLDVLLRHPKVWLLSDDIYEHVVYDGFRFLSAVALEPGLAGRTLTVNGVAKAYAMTGWRIGYGGGPPELIRAMAKIQSQSTSNPCSISQAAAIAALDGPLDFLTERNLEFRRRRDLITDLLNEAPGLHCPKPAGAFYVFPNCAGIIGQRTPGGEVIASSDDFARYLLKRAGVAVVPGAAFGQDPHVRISYATATPLVEEAGRRIVRACQDLGSG